MLRGSGDASTVAYYFAEARSFRETEDFYLILIVLEWDIYKLID